MQNQDYRDPVPLEAADTLEQRLDAGGRQHRRGLVQNQEPRIGDQRAGDLHSLLHLHRQVADTPAGIDVEIEGSEALAATRENLPTAVGADTAAGTELQRLRHGEGGRQRKALVNQLDPCRTRAGDAAETQRVPIDME